MRKTIAAAATVAAMLVGNAAIAAPDPADKCEVSKNKIAGAYYACRAKAEATAIAKGVAADFSKCTAKFNDKWAGAETLGSGMCPDNVVTTEVNAYLAGQAADAAKIIAGTEDLPVCGDGEINVAGEQCDGADLGGYECISFGHELGTLTCLPACGFNVSDCQACPGFSYAGACWVMGLTVGLSCDAVCAAEGLVYDSATATVAGSGGTAAACEDVLDGLGAPGTGLDFPAQDCGSDAVGCVATFMSNRVRCVSPATTSSAAAAGVIRACACQ